MSGRLDELAIEEMDAHLNICAACTTRVIAALDVVEYEPGLAALGSRCWAFEPNSWIAERYLIRRPIGRGGMGEVYEAFDFVLEQDIALKTVKATHCDHPDQVRRLAHELELARRVDGPNVCRVHEVGVHQDTCLDAAEIAYLTMDLIQGPSLAQRLQLGGLAADEVQRMAHGLMQGVADIHRAGVIHRDIKSHNVMLRGNDALRVSIIDFGLAIDARRESWHLTAPSEPEGSFTIEGSPAYMAPEQFRDVCITPATDVFACGVVLFEALTGKLPFRSLRPDRRRAWRDPGEVPLRAVDMVGHVPAYLDAFIARCLELDPTQRYGTAGAALDSLRQAAAT